jgi:signal transduction histidine kinase
MSERDGSVTREMAVPIMRDEKVVAILGTGNKPQNFTTSDVELVSTLADFAWDIVKHKQAEKDISERNQKEKILTQTLHTMQLDIARDLHDTVGQNIGFLRMKLDYLAEKKIRKQAEMQLELRNMARAANESYDLMRGTLAMLQSETSTDLFRLFTRYAEQIEERAAFKMDCSSQGDPRFMSAKRMRQLFYIFREILNNIEKHAHASQVSMQMTWDQDSLKLAVCDNGGGFDPEKVQYDSHYGLRFMRERAELLNGSLLVRSAAGSGTNITLQVPYE